MNSSLQRVNAAVTLTNIGMIISDLNYNIFVSEQVIYNDLLKSYHYMKKAFRLSLTDLGISNTVIFMRAEFML